MKKIYIAGVVLGVIFMSAAITYLLINRTTTSLDVQTEIIGGIVPHHDLVTPEIEKFWQELGKNSQADVIVLVGPDHKDEAKNKIILPKSNTFGNVIHLDNELIENIDALSAVYKDDAIFKNEHSIRLHIPYIEKYFPNTLLVPVLMRSDVGQNDIAKISEIINNTTNKNIAVIASIDFSHYLSFQEAEIMDRETLKALEAYDSQKLLRYGSEHIDSEQSALLVSETTCPNHDCEWNILYHGNSAQIPNQSPDVTTSYYSMLIQ